ncbi:MAG: phosphonoacetaldehyde hydrolase [Propionibacteriaceae bacterium]|nr:phosphonoacetaldehyde hydrolase [Propionibacteriaceae bacterium]
MSHTIKVVILDWAGTTVDYGCFAPVAAFTSAFEHFGVTVTMTQTRAPMGMQKRAHIQAMLADEQLGATWQQVHGRSHTQADIDAIYQQFEPALFEVLPDHAEPLPGVANTVAQLREQGILIGSTTGYTAAMMDVVAPLVARRGYAPDILVCPDDCGGVGRPFPYMLWRNLELLHATSINEVLKVGDTAADMHEAKNAGCCCVGVLKGSSMLGLTQTELAETEPQAQAQQLRRAESDFRAAGADFVIDNISLLPELLEALNTEGGVNNA